MKKRRAQQGQREDTKKNGPTQGDEKEGEEKQPSAEK